MGAGLGRQTFKSSTVLVALLCVHCGGDEPEMDWIAGTGSQPNAGTGLTAGNGSAGLATAGTAAQTAGMAAAGSGGSSAAGSAAMAGQGAGQGAAGTMVAQAGMVAAGVGGAGDGSAGTTADLDAGPPPDDAGSGSRFPSVSDVGAAGPYTPMSTPSSGPGNGYSVYYPEPLGPDGLKNPIITWGNGATTVPPLFTLLPHLASHGFVVIASNNAFVTGGELRAGIDWLIAENERSDSMFYQKLDTEEVASMGYSLGSLGTFEIADDPRLKTTVHISGGAMDKSVVPNLRNPAAFLCGDPSDIAHANCESDFELATVPVFYGVFPGGHLGILGSHTAQINEAATGWLRWRLMHDTSLEDMFVGPSCSLCTDSRWNVKQKDFATAP